MNDIACFLAICDQSIQSNEYLPFIPEWPTNVRYCVKWIAVFIDEIKSNTAHRLQVVNVSSAVVTSFYEINKWLRPIPFIYDVHLKYDWNFSAGSLSPSSEVQKHKLFNIHIPLWLSNSILWSTKSIIDISCISSTAFISGWYT